MTDDNKLPCPRCSGPSRIRPRGPCDVCFGSGRVEPCCVCGGPAREYYDDRPDCPYCGSFRCGYRIQAAMDYHNDRG